MPIVRPVDPRRGNCPKTRRKGYPCAYRVGFRCFIGSFGSLPWPFDEGPTMGRFLHLHCLLFAFRPAESLPHPAESLPHTDQIYPGNCAELNRPQPSFALFLGWTRLGARFFPSTCLMCRPYPTF